MTGMEVTRKKRVPSTMLGGGGTKKPKDSDNLEGFLSTIILPCYPSRPIILREVAKKNAINIFEETYKYLNCFRSSIHHKTSQ